MQCLSTYFLAEPGPLSHGLATPLVTPSAVTGDTHLLVTLPRRTRYNLICRGKLSWHPSAQWGRSQDVNVNIFVTNSARWVTLSWRLPDIWICFILFYFFLILEILKNTDKFWKRIDSEYFKTTMFNFFKHSTNFLK